MVRIGLPLHGLRLVNLLLLERVTSLVGLEGVEGYACEGSLFSRVLQGQLQDRVSHRVLINILEVLQDHCEELIVEVAVVAQV